MSERGTVVLSARPSRHSRTEPDTVGRPAIPDRVPASTALDRHQPSDCICQDGPNVTSPALVTRATRPGVEAIVTAGPAWAMRCRKGKRYPGATRPSGNALSMIVGASANASANKTPTSTGLTPPSMRAASQAVAQSAAGIPRRASHSAAQPASSANPQPRPAPRAALVIRLRISDSAIVACSVKRRPRPDRACPEKD